MHKTGSQFEPINYRGITLSSCLGKLFCHVTNNRISSELDKRSFLNHEQACIRKNYRTSDHRSILGTIVDKYFLNSKNRSKLFARFTDITEPLRIKVTRDLHLTYSKNGGNLVLILKVKNIACLSILLTKHVNYTYLYLFKFVLYSIGAF